MGSNGQGGVSVPAGAGHRKRGLRARPVGRQRIHGCAGRGLSMKSPILMESLFLFALMPRGHTLLLRYQALADAHPCMRRWESPNAIAYSNGIVVSVCAQAAQAVPFRRRKGTKRRWGKPFDSFPQTPFQATKGSVTLWKPFQLSVSPEVGFCPISVCRNKA